MIRSKAIANVGHALAETDIFLDEGFIHRTVLDDVVADVVENGQIALRLENQLGIGQVARAMREGGQHMQFDVFGCQASVGDARPQNRVHLGHVGAPQHKRRRDDLESIGHMLIYFAKGSLPWQGLQATSKKEKYQKILNKKMITGIENLCKGLGNEFAQYMKYCRGLKFYDTPNYSYLLNLFKERHIKEHYEDEAGFDWVILSKKAEISREIMKFKEAKKILDEKFAHMKFNKVEEKKEEQKKVES